MGYCRLLLWYVWSSGYTLALPDLTKICHDTWQGAGRLYPPIREPTNPSHLNLTHQNLYTTNGGSFTNMGIPPTREKGSHLPPRTTKCCNLRNGHDSITAPSAKPDPGFSSWYEGCCYVEPTQGCQKCDRSTFSGVTQVH